jgi:hypothetical protein
LAIPQLNKEKRTRLETELFKKFRDEVTLIDLPARLSGDKTGNCGMYTALLATDRYEGVYRLVFSLPRFVYAPTFGNDPANWANGHSTMEDKLALRVLEANTRKTVVPVNVPRRVCLRGVNLRAIAWTVTGEIGDRLVDAARNRARFLRRKRL